ncbi:MAG: hypothetical protein O3B17_00895 [Actinomycetota bacterium]|jgi:hypothetical protein|nr:hypothetical protein [Ilumatobacteraceae bacterium]MCX6532080.1 hypothetical protein [Actinomycetota bacterium]MDA2954371.1 hypothetical protein [Actinomycetota bacterium]
MSTPSVAPSNNPVQQSWKPHALANPHTNQLDLFMGDTVRSTVELTGVALGSEGKVILANGFNWLRYRVRFANGVEVGDLDQRNIEPIGKTVKRLAKIAKRAK